MPGIGSVGRFKDERGGRVGRMLVDMFMIYEGPKGRQVERLGGVRIKIAIDFGIYGRAMRMKEWTAWVPKALPYQDFET